MSVVYFSQFKKQLLSKHKEKFSSCLPYKNYKSCFILRRDFTMNNAKQYFRIEPWKSVRALKLNLLGLSD